MPGRVYSECFVLTNTKNAWVNYWVPVGMRAVIRDVTITGAGTSDEWAQAEVAGITLMTATFQVPNRQHYYAVRWTVYQGQRMGLYLNGAQMQGAINGFLFEDTSAAAALHPMAEELPSPALSMPVGDVAVDA